MPQIDQFGENWYLASQLFWLALVFGAVFLVIGLGMFPKIEATVDRRDRKIADDLAAAKAAHAASEAAEESYRNAQNSARAEAQKSVADAVSKASSDGEKRAAKVDTEISAKLAAAEAEIAAARSSAASEIENVAGDAVRDLIAKFSGAKVSAADVSKAVKDALHG